DIKNVAIIGHSGEGKTSLLEALLFNAKMIDRMGKTTEGTTVSDFDKEEIAREISVSLSVCHLYAGETKINLLDAPGFFDFEGEKVAALAACGSVIIVCDANKNLSVGTERALHYVREHKIPAIVFINGMDKDNADYFGTIGALHELLPGAIAPVQIPIMENGKMQGYVSLMSGNSYLFSPDGRTKIDMPASLKEEYEKLFAEMTEVAASSDDALMEKFFEEGTLSKEEVVAGVKYGLKTGSAIPVLAGSALMNRGVINLLDNLVRLAPSAADRSIFADETAPFSAQVFQTVADPFIGRLSLMKIKSGTIKNGMAVYNLTTGETEKINAVSLPQGKKQLAVSEAFAGDIVAVAKLTGVKTGDTLSEDASALPHPHFDYPASNYKVSVTAERGEEDKTFQGLSRLAEENPTLKVEKDPLTGETILSAPGDVAVEVTFGKLKNKFGVTAKYALPVIPYRESIRKSAEARGKHKKQTGGHGQFGDAAIRFEPCDAEFEFVDKIVGGVVPKNYIPAVEKGLVDCMKKGTLAGFPVSGVRATLYDGSYHDVDSSDLAFQLAAALAYKEAMPKANPVLLEPVYTFKIRVPNAYLGDILGDMNRRRGRILGMEMHGGEQEVLAEAPISEMQRYAVELRSMTQGRASYTMEFARYEDVPFSEAQKIIAANNQ
ncbi:MAG: elongation factor G, partial [Clostridia bacterium]|nr:elongation factor G [Clostridia bacterium]